jgi:hypothetical protein
MDGGTDFAARENGTGTILVDTSSASIRGAVYGRVAGAHAPQARGDAGGRA